MDIKTKLTIKKIRSEYCSQDENKNNLQQNKKD